MIVAIDGPAGAGKSTVARSLAQELGFTYLDSGAMYRCVALAAGQSGDPPAEVARRVRIELGGRVCLNGRDVTQAIRAPEVTELSSRVAADPGVREALVAKQREIIAGGDYVAEGRDIGTVVAPEAELKVWLTATLAERARRRGVPADEVRRRDERDASRAHSPMVAAPDAVALDTTGVPFDDVVQRVVELARERGAVPR
jgi:CMP/dCMP kinase